MLAFAIFALLVGFCLIGYAVLACAAPEYRAYDTGTRLGLCGIACVAAGGGYLLWRMLGALEGWIGHPLGALVCGLGTGMMVAGIWHLLIALDPPGSGASAVWGAVDRAILGAVVAFGGLLVAAIGIVLWAWA